jgi:multicomponent Na+:H+ antiporter subunit C
MNSAIFALGVGMLFATGTFLVLRRRPIKLLLGLGLLTHGVNLLIFSTAAKSIGLPPIEDKATFIGDISPYVDPLPQALILTAIVISFGITAFIVMLINRRHTIIEESDEAVVSSVDPFAPYEHYVSGLDSHLDDYEWLGYALEDEAQENNSEESNLYGDEVQGDSMEDNHGEIG